MAINLKKFYKDQDDTYLGKVNDIQCSVLASHSRLNKESFLVTYFLENLGLLEGLSHVNRISTLEPGCGVGFFTRYLECFSKRVYAFDKSEAAVSMSKEYNSEYSNIEHFVGDGIAVASIDEIKDKKFDLIYLREFHPLSRNFFDSSEKSLLLLDDYIKLLGSGGVAIIQHAETKENSLKFSEVEKKHNTIGVYHPHILIICLLIFRYKFKISSIVARLLSRLYWKLEKLPLKFTVIKT